jgi:hypothetical protein
MADSIDVKFETIALGDSCGFKLRGESVITDSGRWKDFWVQLNSTSSKPAKLPKIDFKNEMVLGVYIGQRMPSGYKIKISSIKEGNNCLEVYVDQTTPKIGSLYTMAIIQPYHVVRTKSTKKLINFIQQDYH